MLAHSTLAEWFIEEWTPWYGPAGQGDAVADLAACKNRDALPLCLLALNAEGEVLGTAALKADSVGSAHAAGPWLAALLVGQPYRGKGIATALVAAVENEAARMGFDAIYTSTDSAEGLVTRRGWRAVGTSRSLRGAVAIYRWRNPNRPQESEAR